MNINPNSTTVMREYKSSFGGADITAVIGTDVVASLQAISYSVTREKGPVYVMRGDPDPISFARGKRAVAGTLIFLTIDEQALSSHMSSVEGDKFYAANRATRFTYDATAKGQTNGNQMAEIFSLFEVEGMNTESFAELSAGSVGMERSIQKSWYVDQVLPFDVNLSAANEYGQAMKKSFIGVEILNEGGGISIDDLVIEESYTYVCRGMTKWEKVFGVNRKTA